MKIDIRQANETDEKGIWKVLSAAVEYGNTCLYSYDMSYEDILAHWQNPKHQVFVAVNEESEIVGTFYLKPFEAGLSNHVLTGDFLELGNDKSRGSMRAMANAAINQASKQGFASMYLKVIQHNRKTLRVLNQLGFQVTGSIPRAYRSPQGRSLAYVLLIRTIRN